MAETDFGKIVIPDECSEQAHDFVKACLRPMGWIPSSNDFARVLDAYAEYLQTVANAREVERRREAEAERVSLINKLTTVFLSDRKDKHHLQIVGEYDRIVEGLVSLGHHYIDDASSSRTPQEGDVSTTSRDGA